MVNLDSTLLEELLNALGDHLESGGESASIVIVGGSTLAARGWVSRTTTDVDVIAQAIRRDGERILIDADPLPHALEEAVQRVARDYGLPAGWLNTVIGAQRRQGLPPNFAEEIEWRQYAGLEVGLAGRHGLIALKLFAAADTSPTSVHTQDLIALEPTDDELSDATDWVLTQDASEPFSSSIREVLAHVRRALRRH